MSMTGSLCHLFASGGDFGAPPHQASRVLALPIRGRSFVVCAMLFFTGGPVRLSEYFTRRRTMRALADLQDYYEP